jgi:bacillithiol biosynthesis cysteine-adding enzyme BshC
MITASVASPVAPPYQLVPIESRGSGDRLYRDFLDAQPDLARYFGPAYDNAAAVAELAERLHARAYPRDLLVQQLASFISETQAPARVQTQLEMLRSSQSLVVFAGQQPGLFTGPLYAIYKALTVERWAADLSRRLSAPVIPCFWLADDDDDFDEIDHVHLPDRGQVATLRYVPDAASADRPVGHALLDRGIDTVIRSLADCLPNVEFKPVVLEALAACYAPGTSLSVAFARLWYRLFPDSSLLFVSPLRSGLYRLAVSTFQGAIVDAPLLYELFARTSLELKCAGYHCQTHKIAGRSFLFHQGATREPIGYDAAGRYSWAGSPIASSGQLCQAIAEYPEHFSPNVLLRPVVQNALFPTLGVVLGPAEIAYHAQLGLLFDRFNVPRPVILPRTRVTLIEPGVARRLARHTIDVSRLGRNVDAEIARILRISFPAGLDLALHNAAQQIDAAFDPVRTAVEGVDPTLLSAVNAAAIRALRSVDEVAHKLHASHRRREQDIAAQVRSVAHCLFPLGRPQERVHNIVYYWARFGPKLLRDLHEHLPAGRRDALFWPLRSLDGAP